ncbi:MAG: oligosaccharide flippase family protein [Crocinitomicaceae bacterium]|nr:oligosaccharide flippase family protein [Crocinitomicaceae bacterium]
MIKKGSYSSNFLVLFSGGAIGQLVPLLFAPVILRLFEAEEMAVMDNFIALAGMIAIIAAGRYERAIVLPAEKSKAMNLVGIALRIILIVTVLSVFFYFFRESLDSFYEKGKMADFMYLIIVAVPLYAINYLLTEWLIREKKYKSMVYSSIVKSAVGSICIILFGYFSFGAHGLILGTMIGLFVWMLLMYFTARKSLDFSLVSKNGMLQVAKEYKDFPLINSAHAFVDLLFGQVIFYFVITREFGLAELGLFTVMSRYILASMKSVGGSVGQLYYRDASEKYAAGEDVSPSFFRSIKLVALFAVPLCLLILFFGPILFELFGGVGYRKSGEIAQIMIVPLFINFMVSPVSGTPIIYRKQGIAFIFSLFGYTSGIGALILGKHFEYSFYDSLKFYAAAQSLYYLVLFFWYFKLTRFSK